MALLLSVTTFHSANTQANVVESTPVVQVAPAAVVTLATSTASSTDIITQQETESYVRAYFANTPILAEIARCESQFRQFSSPGVVLHGRAVNTDIGIMQINEYYNGDQAKKLGYDIYTLEGNLAFGKWMYDHQGTAPWVSSQPCWGK